MKQKQLKKTIAVHQLRNVLHDILQEKDPNYQLYQNEAIGQLPTHYINEILIIGRQQLTTNKQIKVVKHYYNCDDDTAILLHKLTDAYILAYLSL